MSTDLLASPAAPSPIVVIARAALTASIGRVLSSLEETAAPEVDDGNSDDEDDEGDEQEEEEEEDEVVVVNEGSAGTTPVASIARGKSKKVKKSGSAGIRGRGRDRNKGKGKGEGDAEKVLKATPPSLTGMGGAGSGGAGAGTGVGAAFRAGVAGLSRGGGSGSVIVVVVPSSPTSSSVTTLHSSSVSTSHFHQLGAVAVGFGDAQICRECQDDDFVDDNGDEDNDDVGSGVGVGGLNGGDGGGDDGYGEGSDDDAAVAETMAIADAGCDEGGKSWSGALGGADSANAKDGEIGQVSASDVRDGGSGVGVVVVNGGGGGMGMPFLRRSLAPPGVLDDGDGEDDFATAVGFEDVDLLDDNDGDDTDDADDDDDDERDDAGVGIGHDGGGELVRCRILPHPDLSMVRSFRRGGMGADGDRGVVGDHYDHGVGDGCDMEREGCADADADVRWTGAELGDLSNAIIVFESAVGRLRRGDKDRGEGDDVSAADTSWSSLSASVAGGDGRGAGGTTYGAPPAAEPFRDPRALPRWMEINRRRNDAIDAALETFPFDVDCPPSLSSKEGVGGKVGVVVEEDEDEDEREVGEGDGDGDDGGGGRIGPSPLLESVKILYQSDATDAVRYENRRLTLRLKGKLFRGRGRSGVGCGVGVAVGAGAGAGPSFPKSPFFEVEVRRRRVRRAGSAVRLNSTTSFATNIEGGSRERGTVLQADKKWTRIYRSYPVSRTIRPVWDALDVGQLPTSFSIGGGSSSVGAGGGDGGGGVPVRIDVYDSDRRRARRRVGSGRGGGGRLIGSAEVRTDELLSAKRGAGVGVCDEAIEAREQGPDVEGDNGVFLPLTNGDRHEGWVRIRTERREGSDGGGGGGSCGVQLQLEMFLSSREKSSFSSSVRAFRKKKPSPYFEVSLLEEDCSVRLSAQTMKSKDGAGSCCDQECFGSVSWDWCTIYRSYPVQSCGRRPEWDALEVVLPPDAGRQIDAPIRISVYDSFAGGGSHIERCRSYERRGREDGGVPSSSASATASRLHPGFVGAFEARAYDLMQGEERKFALIRDGWQRGWIYVVSAERCDL